MGLKDIILSICEKISGVVWGVPMLLLLLCTGGPVMKRYLVEYPAIVHGPG